MVGFIFWDKIAKNWKTKVIIKRGCDLILITLAFFLIILLLSGLLAFFDTMLFEYSFLEALRHLFISEIAAGRYIAVAGACIGIIASIMIDVRLHLLKKGKSEGN